MRAGGTGVGCWRSGWCCCCARRSLDSSEGDMTNQAIQRVADASQAPITVTPMEILQRAVERGADIDQLTKLMDLQERWERNEAKKPFVAALGAFKRNPPKLAKNKHVRFQTSRGVTEYDHATLDQVCEVIGKALSEHG